jgi:hypothetical protein
MILEAADFKGLGRGDGPVSQGILELGGQVDQRQALVHPPNLLEAQLLSQDLFGIAAVQHLLEGLGLFQRREVLALNVLHQGHFRHLVVVGLDHAHRGHGEASDLASLPPALPGHQHEHLGRAFQGAFHYHQGFDESLLLDGLGQFFQGLLLKYLARLARIRVYLRQICLLRALASPGRVGAFGEASFFLTHRRNHLPGCICCPWIAIFLP